MRGHPVPRGDTWRGQGAWGAVPGPPRDSPPSRADFFADLHQELAGRSRRRRGEALEEHRSRLEELRGLLLPPPAGLSGHRALPSPQPRGGGHSPGPRPQAGSAPAPREAGGTAASPPWGRAGRPPAARPCEGRQEARKQRSRQQPKELAPAQQQWGLKALYSYWALAAAGAHGGAGGAAPPPRRPLPGHGPPFQHWFYWGTLRGWGLHREAAPEREEARSRAGLRGGGEVFSAPSQERCHGGDELEPRLSSPALPTHLRRVYL